MVNYLLDKYALTAAKDFKSVQNDVSVFIKGRTLVGHALHNDLKVCCWQVLHVY